MEKYVRLKALRPVLLVALIVAVIALRRKVGRRGRCRDRHQVGPQARTRPRSSGLYANSSTVS